MSGSVVDKPKLSVITVVYNSEKHIERTIQSVINQSYTNIEYIIIDGKSNDQTVNIIKRYEDRIAILVSEKDKGIYDAMNKGLNMAKGDYVVFLNSGDEIYANDTIDQVFSSDDNWADIYFGETEIFNENWESQGNRRLRTSGVLTWKSLQDGMLVCHQSFIVKKSIAPNYDLKYKLAADFDWMIKCLKKSNKTENTNIYISKFMSGGKSRQNTVNSLKERFDIMVNNYGLLPVLYNHIAISFKFFRYVFVHRKIN